MALKIKSYDGFVTFMWDMIAAEVYPKYVILEDVSYEIVEMEMQAVVGAGKLEFAHSDGMISIIREFDHRVKQEVEKRLKTLEDNK